MKAEITSIIKRMGVENLEAAARALPPELGRIELEAVAPSDPEQPILWQVAEPSPGSVWVRARHLDGWWDTVYIHATPSRLQSWSGEEIVGAILDRGGEWAFPALVWAVRTALRHRLGDPISWVLRGCPDPYIYETPRGRFRVLVQKTPWGAYGYVEIKRRRGGALAIGLVADGQGFSVVVRPRGTLYLPRHLELAADFIKGLYRAVRSHKVVWEGLESVRALEEGARLNARIEGGALLAKALRTLREGADEEEVKHLLRSLAEDAVVEV